MTLDTIDDTVHCFVVVLTIIKRLDSNETRFRMSHNRNVSATFAVKEGEVHRLRVILNQHFWLLSYKRGQISPHP